MGKFTNKGLYNSYNRSNEDRDSSDYYATPPQKVYNILTELNIDFSNKTILEPSCGGGHMVSGIIRYIDSSKQNNVNLIATDIQSHDKIIKFDSYVGKQYDFLSDSYPYENVDYIIMNPPYSIIEPFTLKSIQRASKGIVLLARMQFLEGISRYNSIFSKTPPTDVYLYVDRIQCYKGGMSVDGGGAQAYAWFIWYLEKQTENTNLHWIRRSTDKFDFTTHDDLIGSNNNTNSSKLIKKQF